MVDRPLDPSEIPVREAIRRGSWVTDTQDPDCSYGSRPDRLLIFPDMEQFLARTHYADKRTDHQCALG